MNNIRASKEFEEHFFAETNDYLHGTMHIEERPLEDAEHYLESISDDEYQRLWPFHLDFYGHPLDDELPTFDDYGEAEGHREAA